MLYSRSQSEIMHNWSKGFNNLFQEFTDLRLSVDNFSAMMAAYASGNAVPPELLPMVSTVKERLSLVNGMLAEFSSIVGSQELAIPTTSDLLETAMDPVNDSVLFPEVSLISGYTNLNPLTARAVKPLALIRMAPGSGTIIAEEYYFHSPGGELMSRESLSLPWPEMNVSNLFGTLHIVFSKSGVTEVPLTVANIAAMSPFGPHIQTATSWMSWVKPVGSLVTMDTSAEIRQSMYAYMLHLVLFKILRLHDRLTEQDTAGLTLKSSGTVEFDLSTQLELFEPFKSIRTFIDSVQFIE